MSISQHDFQLELTGKSPTRLLRHMSVEPDWTPMIEAIKFDLLRRGVIAQPGEAPPITIQPGWGENGGDYVKELRACFTIDGIPSFHRFPISHFKSAAQASAAKLVETGELKKGDLFEYRVLATPRSSLARRPRFSINVRDTPLAICQGVLASRMSRALVFGGVDVATDFPVFIDWQVLQDVAAETRRAGVMETGGVLTGEIYRDSTVPEVFIEITGMAVVPAHGELMKLSFTPAIWSNLRDQTQSRGGEKSWKAWWHSHSFEKQSGQEDAETPGRKVATPFLSADDLALHRQVFPQAHGVALLVTDSLGKNGMSWNLFGWHEGIVVSRGFHLLGAPMPADFFQQGEAYEPHGQFVTR